MNINNLITDNTNVIEIYLKETNLNLNKIDVSIDNKKVNNILNKYKFKQEVEYVLFNKKNLILLYDTTNDSQIIYEKTLENYNETNNLLTLCYNEKKLPPYMYGCDNNYDNKMIYTVNEYKVNNRISIINKKHNNKSVLYISYKHDAHVDLEKNNNIINNILKNII